MHHDSQLTPQTPLPVAISNTQSEKEANICQYSLDNRKNQEAIRAEKQRGADNKWKHGERFFFFFFFFPSSWRFQVPSEEGGRPTDKLGITTSSSCPRFYQVKNFWIIVLTVLFLFPSFLLELFTECEQRVKGTGGVLKSSTMDCFFWLRMVDRCSIWPGTKEFRCGRAGERSAPR